MMGEIVGAFGEFVLGPFGFFGFQVLWSFGAACAVFPIVIKRPVHYALPGVVTTFVLGAIHPRQGIFSTLVLLLTALALSPVLWLTRLPDRGDRRRALLLVGAAFGALLAFPLLTKLVPWVGLLLVPVFLYAVPVALVVLLTEPLRTNPWLPGVMSSASILAAWLTWRTFNHYGNQIVWA
jgi:hypothetical protein